MTENMLKCHTEFKVKFYDHTSSSEFEVDFDDHE